MVRPGDNQPLACAGRHGDLMDFAQIGSRLHQCVRVGRSRGDGRGRYHQVQRVPAVPDQADRPDLLRQVAEREREGLAPSAHRQDEALALPRNCLSRPMHGHVLAFDDGDSDGVGWSGAAA